VEPEIVPLTEEERRLFEIADRREAEMAKLPLDPTFQSESWLKRGECMLSAVPAGIKTPYEIFGEENPNYYDNLPAE